jgi:hypothetical protein
MLTPQHLFMNREASIAAELLASGATLLGRANYAHTGIYGQAFFNLSIGFERAAKLVYIADCAINNAGSFPSNDALKNSIGHDIDRLFGHAEAVSAKWRNGKEYSERPSTNIHNGITQTLTDFARKTRYYNLDRITGSQAARNSQDPMFEWNKRVIQPVIEKHSTPVNRKKLDQDAHMISAKIEDHSLVGFTDEAGGSIDSVYAASQRTGETDVARKCVPFYVLEIARWLAFLISDLSREGAYYHRIKALLGLEQIQFIPVHSRPR